jgi:hypothetical protein
MDYQLNIQILSGKIAKLSAWERDSAPKQQKITVFEALC